MYGQDKNAEVALPFEHLIEQLRRHGLHIGVDHHLRVRQLLNRCAARCSPAELKTLLCPVFATNAEQQELFYRAFEIAYPFFCDAFAEGSAVVPAAGAVAGAPQIAIRRWPYIAAGLIAVILSVAYFTRQFTAERNRPPQQAPAAASTPDAVKPESSSPARSGAEASRASDGDRRVGFEVNRLPPSESRWLAWYWEHRIAIGFTAVLGPLFLWLSWEIYRFRKRRLLIRKARGKVPPYSWPVCAEVAPEIYDPQELTAVSRLLHRRYQGESEMLDVGGTVAASIEALGFPTFRYRRDSRLPEYLFLIDRASFRDHQSLLHEHLATMLRRQGLYVNTYFYECDPRVCWSSSSDEPCYLEDLQRTRAGYRLLLFGNGEQLLDAVTGRLVHWRRVFEPWADRAVLTSEPPSQWGARELTLAAQFAVVPATLEGLTVLAGYFELPASLSNQAWAGRELGADSSVSMSDALRRYLGPDVFQWLCACAIYPELQWDLTLRLGALSCMAPGLVCEQTLVKLLRLEWFRSGSMPDDVRRDLIAQLDPKLEREARESIVQGLETSPAPAETFAASAHQFHIAYQRSWLAPKDRKVRRELKAALENLAPGDLGQDYAYLDAAESVSQSPLQLLLPRRLRKIAYPAGAPWIGPRAAVRLLATTVLAVGGLLGVRAVDARYATELSRYRGDLALGVGLSVAGGSVDGVEAAWNNSLPALRHARSGMLTLEFPVQEGIVRTINVTKSPLDRAMLEVGHTFVPFPQRSVLEYSRCELSVTDEMQNQTAEAVTRWRSLPAGRGSGAPTSGGQGTPPLNTTPAGAIQIAGRTFTRPPTPAIEHTATILDAESIPAAIPVVLPPSVLDRALTATGVLPPVEGSKAVLGRKIYGAPWGYHLRLQDIKTSRLVADNVLLGNSDYKLVITLDGPLEGRRWVYVFYIDSNMVVAQLAAEGGSTANGVPRPDSLSAPATLYLSSANHDFTIARPFGTERIVMIATPEPTDARAVDLSFRGAASRGPKTSDNPLTAIMAALRQGADPTVPAGVTVEVLTVLTAPRLEPTSSPPGNTYALLVGTSRYKDPALSLQFPDADAEMMSQFLSTPRGGALPSQNILLLTDEKATAPAIRKGFQDFLQRRATKNDTVIVFIAAHGTTDLSWSRSAFVLTYDSDPRDLATTALGVSELQEQLNLLGQAVGRIEVFVNFPAGALWTPENLRSNSADLFGFMGMRPGENPVEGAQFGGGHGAFAYFLLKGLQGAADKNGDGFVDAGELEAYVTSEVAIASGNKQHPRVFGNYDHSLRLSDLSKAGIQLR
jgi:hypothetical protein